MSNLKTAVRIKLHQTSANYRREETIENKMTYPLPPISTVIGALHSACGYTEYKEMDVSIQGKFASMHKEPYTDYCFLNSTMDDRGILVKMRNASMLSNAFIKVASAKKSQGNSFLKGITIDVHSSELLEKYRALKKLGTEIQDYKKTEYKEKIKEFKEKKKELADKKKAIGKGNAGFETVAEEEKALKAEEKKYQETVARYEEENYKKPVAKFRTVTKSIRYYEILDQIDLIIHVTADEEILDDILEHAYDLKAIGRSEDFVEVLDVQKVQLEQGEETVESSNCAYLNYEDIKEEKIFSGDMGRGERIAAGTIYYFGKKYEIKEGKRIFSNKKRVLYTSNFGIDETSENIWMDKTEENVYIVNFINFKE